MPGRIAHLFLKPGHGEPMQPVAACQAIAGKGIKNDASFGRAKRQILLIETETLQHFALSPGDVRENITVEGIQLAGLPTSSKLQVGQVLMEVTGDCSPCAFMEDLKPGLETEIEGRRGTLANVLQDGAIRVGDQISVLDGA